MVTDQSEAAQQGSAPRLAADRQVQVRTPLDREVLDRRMSGRPLLHVEIRGTGQHQAHRAAVPDAEEETRTSQQG